MIIDTVPSTIEFEAIDGGYDADRENEPSNDMAIGESEGHMCPATPSILQSRNFRLSPPCAPLRFKLPLDLSASSFPPLPFAVDELEPSSQCGGRHSNLKNLQVDSKRCSPRMDKVKARVLISRAA